MMGSMPTSASISFATTSVRNVCILAHVDHGKTTLSDSLISSNGIISAKSAGRIRFLDCREDEQKRLITMKSSCITLHYNYDIPSERSLIFDLPKKRLENKKNYLVHLVDSPGHVDFSSEVSTAVRLCDGALLVIDAVEGVCPQTRSVLRQAWKERVKIILVINKIDRLILNLHLTPLEAYQHLKQIIEQVNVIMHQFRDEELMATAVNEETVLPQNVEQDMDESKFFDLELEKTSNDTSLDIFVDCSPTNGTVIFCSAFHGWSFTLVSLAPLIAKKLNLSEKMIPSLCKVLWGDFYYNPKTKRIHKKPFVENAKPMFVQFILESIWKVYEYAILNEDKFQLARIAKALNISLHSSSYRSGVDAAQFILSSWLPLAESILQGIVEVLPNPVEAAKYRINQLCPQLKKSIFSQQMETIIHSLETCSPDEDIVLYVAKFLGADLSLLQLTGDKLQGTENSSTFVGFTRIFSGSLSVGTILYICGTAHTEKRQPTRTPLVAETSENKRKVIINRLFLFMGKDIVEVSQAVAGSIVAIAISPAPSTASTFSSLTSSTYTPKSFLEDSSMQEILAWLQSLRDPYARRHFYKHREKPYAENNAFSATMLTSVDRCITLSSNPFCPPFDTPYTVLSSAIVRVSVEPTRMKDMEAFLKGLALLYKADPSVEIDLLESGEYVLGCCGEVHLERCLNDLQQLYSKVSLKVSSPLVAIRESLVSPSEEHPLYVADGMACFISTPSARTPTVYSPLTQQPSMPQRSEETSKNLNGGRGGDPLVVYASTESSVDVASTYPSTLASTYPSTPASTYPSTLGSTYPSTYPSTLAAAHPRKKLVAFPPWLVASTVPGVLSTTPMASLTITTALPNNTPSIVISSPSPAGDSMAVSSSGMGESNDFPLKRRLAVCEGTSNQQVALTVSAIALPPLVTDWLDTHAEEIQAVLQGHTVSQKFLPAGVHEPSSLPSVFSEKSTSLLYTEQLKLCVRTLCSQFASVWKEGIRASHKLPDSSTKSTEIAGQDAYAVSPFFPSSLSTSMDTSFLRGEICNVGTLWGIAVGNGASNILLKADTCTLLMEDASMYKDHVQSSLALWTLLHSSELEKFENLLPKETLKEVDTFPLLYRCDKWIPSLISGFEMACLAGPLAEEPIRGVGFIVESITLKKRLSPTPPSVSPPVLGGGDSEVRSNFSLPSSNLTPPISDREEATATSSRSLPYGPFTGQIMSTMKECCRKALLQRGLTRIHEAMLRIELHCEQEVLGRAFSVLAKRRAQILAEDLREGTSIFAVDAIIPASESFGLAQDLRSKASGKVSLHLQFSHWELLNEDPFPEASMTETEIEDEGEGGPPMNIARKIINDIRKRKGLLTEEKVIVAAEKQRTLGRNK